MDQIQQHIENFDLQRSVRKAESRVELWKSVYPVSYGNSEKWHSTKIPALATATTVYNHMFEKRKGIAGPYASRYAIVASLPFPPPVYFVTPELLAAAARTSLPPGVNWSDLHFPHRAMTFIFPKSAGIVSPSGGEAACAIFSHSPPRSTFKHPFPSAPEVLIPHGQTSVAVITEYLLLLDLTVNWDYDPTTDYYTYKDSGELRKESADETESYSDASLMSIPASKDDCSWLLDISRMVISLALLVATRPELVKELPGKTRPAKGGKIAILRPPVLGLGYRVATEAVPTGDGAGTGTSKRLHWRRGHWREQPFGKGRSQHKLIWIEPMLVGS